MSNVHGLASLQLIEVLEVLAELDGFLLALDLQRHAMLRYIHGLLPETT